MSKPTSLTFVILMRQDPDGMLHTETKGNMPTASIVFLLESLKEVLIKNSQREHPGLTPLNPKRF